MDRDGIIDALTSFFAQPGGVEAAWLFGSAARGTLRPDSDVDVAVLVGGTRAAGLDGLKLDVQSDLEGLLGRTVDLVVVDAAPPDLVHRVLRDGVLLCDHDPSARIRFEVRARNEYWDLLPYLEEYRRGGRTA